MLSPRRKTVIIFFFLHLTSETSCLSLPKVVALRRLQGSPPWQARSEAGDSLTQTMRLLRGHLSGWGGLGGSGPEALAPPPATPVWERPRKESPLAEIKHKSIRSQERGTAEYGVFIGQDIRPQVLASGRGCWEQVGEERGRGSWQRTQAGALSAEGCIPGCPGPVDVVASESAFWKQSTGMHPHDLGLTRHMPGF